MIGKRELYYDDKKGNIAEFRNHKSLGFVKS
jgi:hypothetical protein